MINAVFVILHYQNIDDTINCVNSIKKIKPIDNFDYNIIILDNKSPNNSGIEIKKKYKNNSKIEVILLEDNYGFSIANNIGYKKAKEMKANIILMSNNDVLINDKDFFKKLVKSYKENEKIHIIAPDIINFCGLHQNPLRENCISLKKAYKNFFYKKVILIFLKIPVIKKIIYKFETKRMIKWLDKYYDNNIESKKYSSFVPFGAFIIYFEEWIKNEDIAFPSDTFMYMEEDYLKVYCDYKKYNILYDDKLIINHLEGRSVISSNKNKVESMKFKYKNEALALKKYIKFKKQMED